MIGVQNMVLSIAGAIRDRTSNPITGTYLLTWSITNYKLFVLLLMGTTAPSLRLAEISILYSSNWDVAWSVGVPLISTFLLLVVYPYITDPLIVKYRTWQVKLANSLRKVEDERLLTAAEGATLFSIHESTRDVSARQIASLESENQRLKIDNAEIHKRVKGHPDAAELSKTFEQRQSERPEVRQRAIVDIIRAVFSEWFFCGWPEGFCAGNGLHTHETLRGRTRRCYFHRGSRIPRLGGVGGWFSCERHPRGAACAGDRRGLSAARR